MLRLLFLEGWKFAPLEAISIAKDYYLNTSLFWTVSVSLGADCTFTTCQITSWRGKRAFLEALALGFMWLSQIPIFHWKSSFQLLWLQRKGWKRKPEVCKAREANAKNIRVFFSFSPTFWTTPPSSRRLIHSFKWIVLAILVFFVPQGTTSELFFQNHFA